MLGTKYTDINPGTACSFFPKNKRLKIQKQDLQLINNKNSLMKNSLSSNDYNINNFFNFFSDMNNITYNNNMLNFNSNNNNNNFINQIINGTIVTTQISPNKNLHH